MSSIDGLIALIGGAFDLSFLVGRSAPGPASGPVSLLAITSPWLIDGGGGGIGGGGNDDGRGVSSVILNMVFSCTILCPPSDVANVTFVHPRLLLV